MTPSRSEEVFAVQTFLPYPDFNRSARVLDDKRLGKQRVECLQIMHVLIGLRWNVSLEVIEEFTPRGWRNHPAVLMWTGCEDSLLDYQRSVCAVWASRGFHDTCYAKSVGLMARWWDEGGTGSARPSWLGDAALHRSHQSNLIRKAPAIYRPLFPGVPDDLPYIWPAGNTAANQGV
ncbi:MAG: MSMEG_6728 family protein [Nocardioidaceae bacterium]